MRTAILSCFYPYRGGISQFNAGLYTQLGKTGIVRAFNFSRQYPDFLFPGKTQYVTADDEATPIESERLLDTVNPLSWQKTYKAIKAWKPDLVVISYWMSFLAPALGYIARKLRKDFTTVSVLHNVLPHERRFFDKPLTRYFLKGCHGYVVLNRESGRELRELMPEAKMTELFHPLYEHFGAGVDRAEAQRRLGLEPSLKTILFFGLIREYKGLDILLEAFGGLDGSYQLLVAGEPYGSFDKYQDIIDRSPARDRIHLFLHYIKDSEVKEYFSAADLAVLPYRSATQSGIGATALNFGLPVVVTDVGGLRQSVGETGIGLVAREPEPDCIKTEIERYFSDDSLREHCREAITREQKRLSWQNFGRLFLDFALSLN